MVDRVQLVYSTTVPLEVDKTAPRPASKASVVRINLSVPGGEMRNRLRKVNGSLVCALPDKSCLVAGEGCSCICKLKYEVPVEVYKA